MSGNRKLFLRVLSLALIVTFLGQEISYAAPIVTGTPFFNHSTSLETLAQDPTRFEAPLDYVSMKEIHSAKGGSAFGGKGNGGVFIIHIQDAHSNLSGQQNLAGALDVIMSKYNVSLILVEGSSIDSTLDPIKRMAPSKEICQRVAKKFLMQGKIAGEEYLNLVSDRHMKIMGIEDRALYFKSVENYGLLADKREVILQYLNDIQKSVDKLKQRFYPQELRDYEKHSQDKQTNGFDSSFRKMIEMSLSRNVDLIDLPNVQKLASLQEKEKQIDFNAANLEQAALIDEISKKGGRADFEDSLKKIGQMRNSKASQFTFFQNTLNIAKGRGVSVDKYANFVLYGDYLKDFSELDLDRVLDEIQKMEDRVYKSVIPSEPYSRISESRDLAQDSSTSSLEKNLATPLGMAARTHDALLVRAIDRYLRLLNTAYHIQMSTKDFKLFEVNEPDFSTVAYLAFINRKLAEQGYFEDLIPYKNLLEEGRKALVDFYDSVDKRDTAFIQNTERILKEENQKVAVLISGGYHTRHLKKLVREKGYSYAVLTPIVTSETNQKKYESLLLAPVRKEVKKVEITQGESKTGGRSLSALEKDLTRAKSTDGVMVQKLAEANGARLAELIDELGIPKGLPKLPKEFARRPANLSEQSAGARMAAMPLLDSLHKTLPAKIKDLLVRFNASSLSRAEDRYAGELQDIVDQTEVEFAQAGELMNVIGEIYLEMGLFNEPFYHNHTHTLEVTYAHLLLAHSRGIIESKEDLKLAFLSAILHDFDVRDAGTPANVQRTLSLIRHILGIQESPELAKKISEEKKRAIQKAIFGLAGASDKDDFVSKGLMAELEASIDRTDFFPLSFAQEEYRVSTVQFRSKVNEFAVGRVTEDGMKELLQNFQALRGELGGLDPVKNFGQFASGMVMNIEINYCTALLQVSPERRKKVHELAVNLEKGADQAGYYWFLRPEDVDEVVKSLRAEGVKTNNAGTYSFLMSLIEDPEVQDILRGLPDPSYKQNMIDTITHFSEISENARHKAEWATSRANAEAAIGLPSTGARMAETEEPPARFLDEQQFTITPTDRSEIALDLLEGETQLLLAQGRVHGAFGEEGVPIIIRFADGREDKVATIKKGTTNNIVRFVFTDGPDFILTFSEPLMAEVRQTTRTPDEIKRQIEFSQALPLVAQGIRAAGLRNEFAKPYSALLNQVYAIPLREGQEMPRPLVQALEQYVRTITGLPENFQIDLVFVQPKIFSTDGRLVQANRNLYNADGRKITVFGDATSPQLRTAIEGRAGIAPMPNFKVTGDEIQMGNYLLAFILADMLSAFDPEKVSEENISQIASNAQVQQILSMIYGRPVDTEVAIRIVGGIIRYQSQPDDQGFFAKHQFPLITRIALQYVLEAARILQTAIGAAA